MIPLDRSTLLAALDPSWASSADASARILDVSTDTRDLTPCSAFFAIDGEHHAGVEFVDEAARSGAVLIIADDGSDVRQRLFDLRARHRDLAVATVPRVRAALGAAASLVRAELTADVIAITGSCGKTSTKEILGVLGAVRGSTVVSPASFNNDIGVPRTIFLGERTTDLMVLEVGTNARGEIRTLAEIAQPRVAVVTNVGRSHLAGLGSVEGVAREKGDLIAALEPHSNSACVLNRDCAMTPKLLRRVPARARVITVSATGDERADLFAVEVGDEARARAGSNDRGGVGTRFRLGGPLAVAGEWTLPLPGRHALSNLLAALGAFSALRPLDARDLAQLDRLAPAAHRLETHAAGGVTIIDDAYNANPESMAAALDVLTRAPGRRRIAVLGPMAELGPESIELHSALGRELGECAGRGVLDAVLLVGDVPEIDAVRDGVADAIPVVVATAWRDALDELQGSGPLSLAPGDVALVKASRASALERVVAPVLEGLLSMEVAR